MNCILCKLYLSKATNNKSSSWLQCAEQRCGKWTNEEAATGMEQKTVVELRGEIHGGQTRGQVRTVYILWQAPQVLLGSWYLTQEVQWETEMRYLIIIKQQKTYIKFYTGKTKMNAEKCVALLPISMKSAQGKSSLSCRPGYCPDCPFSLSNSKERA